VEQNYAHKNVNKSKSYNIMYVANISKALESRVENISKALGNSNSFRNNNGTENSNDIFMRPTRLEILNGTGYKVLEKYKEGAKIEIESSNAIRYFYFEILD